MDDVSSRRLPSIRRPTPIVALELAEGPLFISSAVGLQLSELREGMTLEVQWSDGSNRFGDYNLAVFGPPAARA